MRPLAYFDGQMALGAALFALDHPDMEHLKKAWEPRAGDNSPGRLSRWI